MAGDRKNPVHPQPAPHCCDRVREGHITLPRPVHHVHPCVLRRQLRVQQRHYCIETEQAWTDPQHRVPTPAPCRLQPEVTANLLKHRLDVPTTGVGLDHHLRAHRRVGREEVFIPVRPGPIVDEDPAHQHELPPALNQHPFPVTTSTRRRPPPYQLTPGAAASGCLGPPWPDWATCFP